MSYETVFEIGGKKVIGKEICELLPPSDQELGYAAKLLGRLAAAGTPILRALELTAEGVDHPWLVMAMSLAWRGILDGGGLGVSIHEGILKFEAGVPRAPNLSGFFNPFVNLLDLGEETGELDTALTSFARVCEEAGTGTGLLRGKREVHALLCYFRLAQDLGLPLLRILRVLERDPRHYKFKTELGRICEEIEGGALLSEAFQTAQGALSDPLIVNFVERGEAGGALEIVLQHLTR